MTKLVTTVNAVTTTSAAYRTWGLAVSAALVSAGLVKVTQTGQIDWTTATAPTLLNTAGFEVFRFDDTLQSTAPIYLKVGYYGANSSNSTPLLTLQMGTGVNGSGTLTGTVTTNQYTGWSGSYTSISQPTPTNTAQVIRMCSKPGYFMAIANTNVSSTYAIPFGFCVSRTVDDAGAPTAAGAYLWMLGPQTGSGGNFIAPMTYAVNFATGVVGAITNAAAAPPGDLTNYDTGDTAYVLPHYACLPAPKPVVGVVTTRTISTGWPEGSEFDCAVVGSTPRHYAVLGPGITGNTLWANTAMGLTNETAYGSAAFLWED